MVLEELAEVSARVAATSSRSRKTELLAELFARTEPAELPVVIAYLSGRLPQAGWVWGGGCCGSRWLRRSGPR